MKHAKPNNSALYLLASLGAGMLFGIGLTVSEMVNPERVLGFLDVFGEWDPALVFVMIGALVFSITGYQLIKQMKVPVFGVSFLLPDKKSLDKPLIVGAILFGLGWGLVGLCPGPAITALLTFNPGVWIFLFSMSAGILVQKTLFS